MHRRAVPTQIPPAMPPLDRSSLRGLVVAAALVIGAAAPARAVLPQLVIGVGEATTLGGVAAAKEDLLLCQLQSVGPGSTTCRWSRFFDGHAAGLNTTVVALEVLPDGSLVMRVNADNAIPDIQ